MLFISILLVFCSSTNHNCQVAPQHALHMMQLLDEEPVSFSTSRVWGDGNRDLHSDKERDEK
jgi:hypothetical protein